MKTFRNILFVQNVITIGYKCIKRKQIKKSEKYFHPLYIYTHTHICYEFRSGYIASLGKPPTQCHKIRN